MSARRVEVDDDDDDDDMASVRNASKFIGHSYAIEVWLLALRWALVQEQEGWHGIHLWQKGGRTTRHSELRHRNPLT
jgi:hypothetical protein